MIKQILFLIDSAISNEKKAYNYLQMYSKKIDKPSLQNLLISIINQEKEHEKQLRDLKQKKNIQNDFNEELLTIIHLDSFAALSENETNLIPTQFMQFIMKYFDQTKSVYDSLATAALDSELRLFFIKLSDSELKLKQWIQDRYDLELLSL